MRAGLLLLLLLLLPSTARAQEMCAAEAVGDVPPCMVGYWTGENDMAERLDQMFAMLPDHVWASGRPESGRHLFIRIAPDGSFVTSPLHAAADAAIFSDEGFVGQLRATLDTLGGTGLFFQGPGDGLRFCMRSGGWGTIEIEGEGGSAIAPVGPNEPGFIPAMRYACAGDRLKMFMDLPPPMGTVTYDLRRIPASAIPPEFEALFD